MISHFTAHTINCIRSMFRVLGIYNFEQASNIQMDFIPCLYQVGIYHLADPHRKARRF